MGSAVKILPHYTYEDYKLWEGKWEIIEGIPYAMSPAPVPKHQYLANNIGGELRNLLKSAGCKNCKASQAIDYLIEDDTIVQPDVLIYCGLTHKPFLNFTPKLVVEILSPATALKDRHTKYRLYEKAGINWYLMVNPDTESVQVFALENSGYVQKQEGHAFTYLLELDEDCKIELDLGEIW
jgi:Uma2 family endonuclease